MRLSYINGKIVLRILKNENITDLGPITFKADETHIAILDNPKGNKGHQDKYGRMYQSSSFEGMDFITKDFSSQDVKAEEFAGGWRVAMKSLDYKRKRAGRQKTLKLGKTPVPVAATVSKLTEPSPLAQSLMGESMPHLINALGVVNDIKRANPESIQLETTEDGLLKLSLIS
jgi:hypothetical protein